MSLNGYKRKFQPPPRHVCSTPNSRHSLADVRYRADFVRFTPESGRGGGRSRESEVDPFRKSRASANPWGTLSVFRRQLQQTGVRSVLKDPQGTIWSFLDLTDALTPLKPLSLLRAVASDIDSN